MNLPALFFLLEEIRDTSSRNEKDEVLEEIVSGDNAEVFKDICKFVYDPYRKVHLKVTASLLNRAMGATEKFDRDESLWVQFLRLLKDLENGKITGNNAREAVVEFLGGVEFDIAEWFPLILNKNLKIGVGRKSIEKLFGKDFVPCFNVQLCGKYNGTPLAHEYMVQPKMDGVRGVVAKFPGFGKRVALTRNGRELYNLEAVQADFDRLEHLYKQPMVFDGEFYAGDWETTMSIVRRSTRGHSKSAQLKFYIFDAIPLSEWIEGQCSQPLRTRDVQLLEHLMTLCVSNLVDVPHDICSSPEEVKVSTGRYVEEGWEGSILKDPESFYTYDRSSAWLKCKDILDVDAEIIDVNLGWLDQNTNAIVGDEDPRDTTGWTPIIRSLVVDPGNGVPSNVGSGLEINDKIIFHKMFEDCDLTGRIVEVHFQEYTPDGRLRFPRFKRLRDDR